MMFAEVKVSKWHIVMAIQNGGSREEDQGSAAVSISNTIEFLFFLNALIGVSLIHVGSISGTSHLGVSGISSTSIPPHG